MANRDISLKVEGLRELQREIRRLQDADLKQGLRAANRRAAAIVKDAADPPRRTGRLARSVGVVAGLKDAVVKAGSASVVPYAGPVHYGWPARHIKANPFILRALKARLRDVRSTYEDLLSDIADEFNRR